MPKMRTALIGMMIFFISCVSDKVILLPEINNAKIVEVLDVSPAYIFYDESKEDSVELNRKNLIITTNWLVNVDKRLTLEQALPSILKLQDKKRSAKMHKNENARNYYTCNDTAIKNLGFMDFTDVYYFQGKSETKKESNTIPLFFETDNRILTMDSELSLETIDDHLNEFFKKEDSVKKKVVVNFNKKLTFQEYIKYKSLLVAMENDSISVSNNEFIY